MINVKRTKQNNPNKKKANKSTISLVLLIFSLLITLNINNAVADVNNDDLLITVNNQDMSGDFRFGFNEFLPINIDVVSSIKEIDHVKDVISLVIKYYGDLNFSDIHMDNTKPPTDWNGSAPPDWNGNSPSEWDGNNPPDWNISNRPGWDDNMPGSNNQNNMRDNMFDYIVYGIPLDSSIVVQYDILPSNIIEGSVLKENDTGKILIAEELKDYFNVNLGESVAIDGMNFQVIGIYKDDEISNYIYMSLSDAQKLLNMEENEVNTIVVYSDGESYVESIASEIKSFYPDYRVIANGFIDGFDDTNRRVDWRQQTSTSDNNTTPGFEIIFIVFSALIILIIRKRNRKHHD